MLNKRKFDVSCTWLDGGSLDRDDRLAMEGSAPVVANAA